MGPQEASDRILLKQSVQFSVGQQVRVIEMTLPLRLGAPAEEIERLLQQADAGLDQMTQHLNKKVAEFLEQAPGSAAQGMAPVPLSAEMEGAPLSGAQTGNRGAGVRSSGENVSRPTHYPPDGLAATSGSPLDRKQFIAQIAVLGLNPRQAMERLGVRTLDGLNLRQALEQLRQQLLHERAVPPGAASAEEPRGALGTSAGIGSATHPGTLPAHQPPDGKFGPQFLQTAIPGGAAGRPVLEGALSLHEARHLGGGLAEEGDQERPLQPLAVPIPIRGAHALSAFQERGKAMKLLEHLRRLCGRLYPPSSDQVRVFHNVVEQQLGSEKVARLLYAVWQVSTPEQLSRDQIDECIHWGKADEFDEEVEMILDLTAAEGS